MKGCSSQNWSLPLSPLFPWLSRQILILKKSRLSEKTSLGELRGLEVKAAITMKCVLKNVAKQALTVCKRIGCSSHFFTVSLRTSLTGSKGFDWDGVLELWAWSKFFKRPSRPAIRGSGNLFYKRRTLYEQNFRTWTKLPLEFYLMRCCSFCLRFSM